MNTDADKVSTRPDRWVRASVRAMAGYVPGEQPDDPSIIKLNTNENPYPPPPGVMQTLAALDEGDLRIYPDPVCRALREDLAACHGCRPGNILIGNGSDEVLALCTRALVERGGTVGYFDPSYSLYPVLAAIEGLATRPVPLGEAFGWVDPPADAGELFFLTHPNAPTGMAYAREEIEAFCRRYPGVVVIDEAYAEFAGEHCLDLALSMDQVLVTRTFSKAFSLAGIRLGYLVGPEPLVDALYKVKDSYNLNRLTQEAGRAALREQDVIAAQNGRIRATRERVAGELERRGFRVAPSHTNFLWVRPTRGEARDLFYGLRERRILVRYFDQDRLRDGLRISIGTDAQMDALLRALDEMESAS